VVQDKASAKTELRCLLAVKSGI